MIYHFGGQTRTVKRPDYSYERLLALSRSTKSRRWRHRKSQARNSVSMGDYSVPGKSSRSASLIAAQGMGMKRQSVSTAAIASPSISRQNSVQDRGGRSPVHTSTSRSLLHKTSDISGDIPWCDWTDSIRNRPHTDIVQRVVDMWQKVLRGWKRNHRPRTNSFGHRRDSSLSIIGGINVSRTSDAARSSIDNAADKSSVVSSGFTAMLDPYVIEPIGLQRGVSESGRHSLPNNPASLMRQLTGYSQLDNLMMVDDAFDKARTNSATSKSTMECRDDMSKQPMLQHVSKLTTMTGAMAPHRRLSIVKDHEMGRSVSSSDSVSSATSENSDDGASSASSNASLVPPDKESWVLAQFEDTDEAVNVLLLFHARLQERLRKAKTESEEELLSITQGLSEFVEEGLSYVHEEYDDEQAHTDLADESDSDGLYSSDGAETPGLTMSRQGLRAEGPATHLRNAASKSSYSNQGHWTSEAASKQLELKSLNRRLHDVLNQHSNGGDANRGNVRSTRHKLEASEAKSEKQPMSPMRLPRVPSIRRMAFLRSISGEGGSTGTVSTFQPETTKDSAQTFELNPSTDSTASTSVCYHNEESIPCIVCTPSIEDTEYDAMRP
ncbi:hypothetical protein IWW36_005110, partial [Coemansia brasiliensis]